MASADPLAQLALDGLRSPDLDDLGVTLTAEGGRLRVWSAHASAVELVVFDEADLDWITGVLPLERVDGDVWTITTPLLRPGTPYGVRVDGPLGDGNLFNPETILIEPYSKGLVRGGTEERRSLVIDQSFDWGDTRKPAIPLDRTVLYEGHVKGLSKRHPQVPAALRGTYAGLAHPAMIEHFHALGITSIELLPVHTFATEPRLLQHGLVNYWGYNTLNFFSPHAPYATLESRLRGPEAVLREFKGMVKLLHEAGLEVILDVVYNHTAELGIGEPRSSFRGIDNRSYYRQHVDGAYIDVTGCGNSVDTSTDAAARLVLDSLRYWANDLQVDGFRFDLAATLGRDATHTYTQEHPLLQAIVDDPALAGVKMIAEPWDVGMGGWQTGNFPDGWLEWNDRYRDRVRNFWLSDVDYARRASTVSGRGRRLRQPPRGLGEHLQRRTRPPREYQLRHRARRIHPARSGLLRRQAQPRQRRAQPRRGGHEPILQPRRRRTDRRTSGFWLRAGERCATCSARSCSPPGSRCSPRVTSSPAHSAATTTRIATTRH